MSMIIATLTFLLITLHDDDDDDYDDDNDDDDDYYYDDDDEYLQHPAALDSSSLLGQSSCVSHSQDPGIHLKLEHLYSSGGQTRSLSANKATLGYFSRRNLTLLPENTTPFLAYSLIIWIDLGFKLPRLLNNKLNLLCFSHLSIRANFGGIIFLLKKTGQT